MGRYILKRILLLVPVIIGVSFLIFVMMDMAPGTIIDTMLNEATPEVYAQMEHELGYDRSVFYRYFKYMSDLLHGDMGFSYLYKVDVWKLYEQRFPNTLKLAMSTMLVAILFSLPLGILASLNRGNVVDNLCSVGALLGISMPSFWMGLLLIILFAQKLGWLPSSGATEGIRSLILPAFTTGTGMMAAMTRTTRSSMLDVLQADYLRTARSKGVPQRHIVLKHALRNALIPVITVFGTQLGGCFGGSVVVENVFNWPGVGQLLVTSIKSRDTTVVCGIIIVTVTLICVIQLIVDLLYAWVDPRLRAQYTSKKKKKTVKKEVAVNG